MAVIRSVEAHWLQAHIPEDRQHLSDFGRMDTFNSGLVIVRTDDGGVGYGEGKVHVGSAGNYRTFCAYVHHELRPLLLGDDPDRVSGLWQKMYCGARAGHARTHGRTFPTLGRRGVPLSAISAVDIALWDLKWRQAGLPVYDLLGGKCRDRILAYASGGWCGVGEIGDEGREFVRLGYRALKIRAGLQDPTVAISAQRVRELRAAVGPDVQLMIDAHGTLSVADAKRLCRKVEDCDVAWFEEPTAIDHPAAMAEVRSATDIPIAAGESEQTRFAFRDLLLHNAIDVAQPDLGICGGLSEARQIASLASAFQVQVAPHLWGGAVLFAAGLHFAAATPCVTIAEHCHGFNPMLHDMVFETFPLKDGCLSIPGGPGLGVTVREDFIAEHSRTTEDEL